MSTANRVEMNYLTCVLVNGPVAVLNILANAFFIFCMLCPLNGERIKQPLKLLLWSLICCTITFLISVFVIDLSGLPAENNKVIHVANLILGCTMTSSMNSSVWLNFFYYTQIVPAQRALFIWIKKNIKPIIYCIWTAERIYSLFEFTVRFVSSTSSDGFNNITMTQGKPAKWLTSLYISAVIIVNSNFFISLCVMVMSSASTVVYLCRHMRHMVSNGQPICCPRFSGQVRVTATGILQGVLYVFFSVWTVYGAFSTTSIGPCCTFTVLNLYMAGTTFNLGAGQAVFRQRAADICLRAAQCCKVSKVQQSEQEG